MRICTRLGLIGCIFALLPQGAQAQSGHELFQQALVSERSRADLEQAVQLYQRIADEHAEDGQLVARALLRLGGIQETLGGQGAIATYERVAREYSGVEPEATQARARLSALRAASPTGPAAPPTRRLILDYTEDDLGESRSPGEYWVTQDGTHLLSYHEARRAFELVDIDSREIRALTQDGPDPDLDRVAHGLLSHGDEIAATVERPRDPRSETRRVQLRVFDVGGSGEGRLVYTWERSPYIQGALRPFGWSMDDTRVWMWGMRTDQSAEIAWVDVTTGAFGVLKTLAWGNHSQFPSLSPDGRFIAFHDADTREDPADVFVIATDGSRELRLEHPADDSHPMFAPDGSGVVFVSNRREGIRDLWFQPLTDGRASGDPRIVFRDVIPLGTAERFSDNGSLAYYFGTRRWEIYTAELDVAAGLVGPPVRVEPRRDEMNQGVAFSPDGRYLAHTRDRGRRLVLRDVESGSEREYPLGRMMTGRPQIDWCPVGPVAFVSGYWDVAVGLRVDLESGGAERLPLGNPGDVRCIGDGDEIIYEAVTAVVGEASRIVRRSLVSGAEKVLYQGRLSGVSAPSPDATRVAFVEMGADEARLIVLPIDGGEPQTVATAPLFRGFGGVVSQFAGVAWLPEGDALLVVRSERAPSLNETAPTVILSRLALETGIETEVGRLRLPASAGGWGAPAYTLSPDGSRIAFNRVVGNVAQVWAIDGLLPYIQSGESAPPEPSVR